MTNMSNRIPKTKIMKTENDLDETARSQPPLSAPEHNVDSATSATSPNTRKRNPEPEHEPEPSRDTESEPGNPPAAEADDGLY